MSISYGEYVDAQASGFTPRPQGHQLLSPGERLERCDAGWRLLGGAEDGLILGATSAAEADRLEAFIAETAGPPHPVEGGRLLFMPTPIHQPQGLTSGDVMRFSFRPLLDTARLSGDGQPITVGPSVYPGGALGGNRAVMTLDRELVRGTIDPPRPGFKPERWPEAPAAFVPFLAPDQAEIVDDVIKDLRALLAEHAPGLTPEGDQG